MLGVDAFLSGMCTAYATPQTVADNLATYGSAYRSCYAWLGPNQPGVNETDPRNPSACVPDPGGEPTGETVTIQTNACKLEGTADALTGNTGTTSTSTSTTATTATPAKKSPTTVQKTLGSTASGAAQAVTKTLSTVGSTITSVLEILGHAASGTSAGGKGVLGLNTRSNSSSNPSSSTGTGTSTSQAQALLRYLTSP